MKNLKDWFSSDVVRAGQVNVLRGTATLGHGAPAALGLGELYEKVLRPLKERGASRPAVPL